jgi:hypothetical protein
MMAAALPSHENRGPAWLSDIEALPLLSGLFCLDSLWGEGAELEQPRRHPKAFGIPANLLTGTPSSVPCPTPTHVRGKEQSPRFSSLIIFTGVK